MNTQQTSFSEAIAPEPDARPRTDVRRFRVRFDDVQSRSLSTTTGAGAVGTLMASPGDFIQAARSKSVAGRLGARFTALSGGRRVALPRFTAGGSPRGWRPSWLAEGAAPGSGVNPTLDEVVLDPKRVTATVRISRALLASAGPGLDAWLLADMAAAIGAAVDAAAFTGVGTAEPVGLVDHPDVPVFALGTNGADPTRAALINAVKAVALADGDASASTSLGWATSPDGEAKLRSVDGSSGGAGRWLWDAERILDRPAVSTTAIPNDLTKGSGTNLSALIYGDFDQLVIDLSDGFDVLVNPYTAAPDLLVTVALEAAVAVRRASSFVKILDMKTS